MSKLLSRVSAIVISAFVVVGGGLPVSAAGDSKVATVSAGITLRDQERKAIADLAKHCGLKKEKLEEALSFEVSEKSKFFGENCSLVPVCDRKEHLDCFLRVFSEARPEYMRYYASGKLKSAESVKAWFERAVKNIGQDSPKSATFLIKVGDNVVGRIGIGPLADRGKEDTEIGYAIEEAYSHQGVMGKAVDSAIAFLTLLREGDKKSMYDFTRLRATAKFDNKPSNKILCAKGFVKSKEPADDGCGPENEYFYYFEK